MSIDCLCAGILFADVVGSPVDRAPDAGQLVPAERIHLSLGGCAANAALDLAKLGVAVGVSGCVGDDVFGQYLADTLSRGGVDTSAVRRADGINTACTMIINVRGEDRRFVSSVGANTRMTVDHIPDAWLRQAKVLYVGGYLMLPGLETPEMASLMRRARAAGCKTVLDVVYIGSENSMDALALVLPETDVFLPNDDEAAILIGSNDALAQADAFRNMGAKTVVITEGEKGCVLVTDGLRVRAGCYPTTFVGGTGAGDAFDAGFIAGMLRGESPLGCIRWGAALGASCVRSTSATESVFTRSEAEAFLAANELPLETIV